MQDPALIGNLKQFGLNEWEAKTYLALSISSKLSASEINEKTGIPLSKVYEVAKSLENKSLATCCISKPLTFMATEPSHGLKLIIERQRHGLTELEGEIKGILNKLGPMTHKKEFTVRLLSGSELHAYKILEVLSSARKFAYFMTYGFVKNAGFDKRMLKIIKQADAKAILLTDLEGMEKAKVDWLVNKGMKIKQINIQDHPCILVTDKSILLKPKNEESFVSSDHPAYIRLFKDYFEASWKVAAKRL